MKTVEDFETIFIDFLKSLKIDAIDNNIHAFYAVSGRKKGKDDFHVIYPMVGIEFDETQMVDGQGTSEILLVVISQGDDSETAYSNARKVLSNIQEKFDKNERKHFFEYKNKSYVINFFSKTEFPYMVGDQPIEEEETMHAKFLLTNLQIQEN